MSNQNAGHVDLHFPLLQSNHDGIRSFRKSGKKMIDSLYSENPGGLSPQQQCDTCSGFPQTSAAPFVQVNSKTKNFLQVDGGSMFKCSGPILAREIAISITHWFRFSTNDVLTDSVCQVGPGYKY
jgi:hypothetical protein